MVLYRYFVTFLAVTFCRYSSQSSSFLPFSLGSGAEESHNSYKMLTDYEVQMVFENYLALSVAPDQKHSRQVTEQLTEEELELAAICSYAYYITSVQSPGLLTEEIRFATAMREANRHLDGIDDVATGLKLLRESLVAHKELRSHVYKTCMDESFQYKDMEDKKLAILRRNRIIKENRDNQAMIIRGQDKQGNAVWVAMPRKNVGDDPQAFVDVLLYTVERCAATTEALSLGKNEKMVAILDLRKSCSPSIKAMKSGISILQSMYPGRLKNLIVLDLNYILQGIYNCIKPFLDPDTRSKFVIVSGTKAKEAAVSIHLEPSQAQSNILKRGHLSAEVDGEWFVKNVPFCRLYDYVPKQGHTSKIPSTISSDNHHIHNAIKKDSNHIPATHIRSPRTFKTKSRSLAAGTIANCMTRITVTSLAS